MGTIDFAATGIHPVHLPERWAVLEQALAQMEREDNPETDIPEGEGSVDDRGEEHTEQDRNRDAEDTRSRNQPVRPTSGQASGGDQQPRGGLR